MVKLNKEFSDQNNDLIQSLGSKHGFDQIVIEKALKEAQDPKFYTEGLFLLLLNGMSQGIKLGEIGDALEDITSGGTGGGTISTELKDINDHIGELSNSIKEYQNEYYKSTGHIYQDIKSTEVSGKFSEKLISLRNRINQLKALMTADLTLIRNYSSDSILKYDEKVPLTTMLMEINEAYQTYITEGTNYTVSTTKYTESHQALKSYISEFLFLGSSSSTTVDSIIMIDKYTVFFNERINILEAIYSLIVSEALRIGKEAAASARDLGYIISISGENPILKREIVEMLKTFYADSKLSPTEKVKLNNYIAQIASRYDLISEIATRYKMSFSSITTTRNQLLTHISTNSLLTDLTKTTLDIGSSTTIITLVENYFNTELALLNSLLTVINGEISDYDGQVVEYSTRIDQTDKKIEQSATSTKVTQNKVEVNTANVILMADQYSVHLKKILTEVKIQTKFSSSSNVNLFSITKSLPGYVDADDGSISSTAIDGSRYSEGMIVEPSLDYIATLYENMGTNTITISHFDSLNRFIKSDEKTSSEKRFSLSIKTPDKTAYSVISALRVKDSDLQFEKGNVSSSYRLSPEDVVNNIVLAREQYEERYALYTAFFDLNTKIKSEMVSAKSIISSAIDDGKLTIAEKKLIIPTINQYIANDAILFEKCHEYGVIMTAYEEAYLNYTSHFRGITSDISKETSVDKELTLTIINKVMNEAYFLLESLLNAHLLDYNLAEAALNLSTSTSVEADYVKNELTRRSEEHARTLLSMNELLEEEATYSSEFLGNFTSYLDDGVLSPIEKTFINSMVARVNTEDDWYITKATQYKLGYASFENKLNLLLNFLQPMLTIDNLLLPSNVNSETALLRFNEYSIAKKTLLTNIINAAKGEYDIILKQLAEATNQSNRKSEELIKYYETITEATKEIAETKQTIEELKNAVPYFVELNSSNGSVFTGGNVESILSVRFLRGNEDITDAIDPIEGFVWYKRTKANVEDTEWNLAHRNVGNSIEITHEDVDARATFGVKIFMEAG